MRDIDSERMFRILVILFENKYKTICTGKGYVWGVAGYFVPRGRYLLAQCLKICGIIAIAAQIELEQCIVHGIKCFGWFVNFDPVVAHADYPTMTITMR